MKEVSREYLKDAEDIAVYVLALYSALQRVQCICFPQARIQRCHGGELTNIPQRSGRCSGGTLALEGR